MGNKSSHQSGEAIVEPIEPRDPDPLPQLTGPTTTSSISLTEDEIRFLMNALPTEDHKKKWNLLYVSDKHGKSYNRFCFHVTGHGPTIILIRDNSGTVFGGFASDTWKDKYPKYYGTGHCFVFKLRPERAIYKPTGYNDHFMYLNHSTETLFNGVGMGGQTEFFTWCIQDDFETGKCRGNPSSTYGCPPLTPSEDWTVDYVEAWEVKELTELTYEQEKILKKKNKEKSVLDDEDNAEKVITGMLGHNYHTFEKMNEDEEIKSKNVE